MLSPLCTARLLLATVVSTHARFRAGHAHWLDTHYHRGQSRPEDCIGDRTHSPLQGEAREPQLLVPSTVLRDLLTGSACTAITATVGNGVATMEGFGDGSRCAHRRRVDARPVSP